MQNLSFAKKIKKDFILLLIFVFLLSACQPAFWGAPPPSSTPITREATLTATIMPLPPTAVVPNKLSVSPAVPSLLRDLLLKNGFQLSTSQQKSASHSIDVTQSADNVKNISTWTYALVVPFPTLMDDVTSQDLRSAWSASSFLPFAGIPLLMDESTLLTFSALWGEPAEGAVQIVPADELLDTAWNQMPAWAIIPFESIEPKWKVLMIDGQSPIQKKFDSKVYPLIAAYQLTCTDPCLNPEELSFQNRDPKKLATVILTGVTALVRATADKMEKKGVLYPAEEIRDLLREADITHINNEVPFYSDCPTPDPNQKGLVFCSDPRYMELLTDIGTDVMELSGDHFADYGQGAMYETIDIYKANNLPYYGGGLNAAEGLKPLLLEVNGNKLMFIGCNYKVQYASATDTIPGSVACDFEYETEQIRYYRSQGYLPIATFQYHEYEAPETTPQQVIDFRTMAEAGAVIVSGSQAHVPQVMEFYRDAFIHYGLGNLFFDQFTRIKQNEFIDRHIFYDGRYLGVELITTFLEHYARPRFMMPAERNKFLLEYFDKSGWGGLQAGQ